MSKHTPGPWTCDVSTSGPYVNPEKKLLHASYILNRIGVGFPAISEHEASANAHLIACAPEMAEMLLSMYVHVSHGGPTREEAEALLKKAGVL